MKRSSLALIALCALGLSASGQLILQTTLAGGNSQKGNMFDITNISGGPVVIRGFEQNFQAAGTATFEIYAKTAPGSYVGSEATAAAWTLLGTSSVTTATAGTPVLIPITIAQSIAAGATQAFYLTCTNATTANVAYTNGAANAVNTVYVADTNIQFKVGIGKAYPFGSNFGGTNGRIWNGRIRYTVDALYADFTATPLTGSVPLPVNFTELADTNAPGGITAYEWDFDDNGIIDSTAANPTWIYNVAGSYTVTLTVYDGVNPPATRTRTNYVTPTPEIFRLITTGAGDLTMSAQDDPPGCTEGMLLVSLLTGAPVGSGPIFGLQYDPSMLEVLASPATPCSLLHWLPTPGCWPNVNLSFPPGSINLPGFSLDAVVLQVVPPNLLVSNVARVTF